MLDAVIDIIEEKKAAFILALAYYVPWVLLTGGHLTPPNNVGAALGWFLYLILAVPLLIAVAVLAKIVFDIPLVPWGLAIIILPLLIIFAVPALPIVDALWYIPPAVAFVIGLIKG